VYAGHLRGVVVSVFISYSRADEAQARELAEDLEALGREGWYDRELTGGQEWWDAILEQVRKCDVLFFVVSGASLESKACLLEYRYGLDLGKVVVPVLVDVDVSADLLPEDLRKAQCVDYRAKDKKALKDLARTVASPQAQPRPLPNPLPAPPAAPVSDIATLRDRVTAPSVPPKQQNELLVDLVARLNVEEERTLVRELLDMLRNRDDVTYRVRRNVDALLRDASAGGWFSARPVVALTAMGFAYLVCAWTVGFVVHEVTGRREAARLWALVFLAAGALGFGSYRLARGRRRTT
jgi:hypothetical protein